MTSPMSLISSRLPAQLDAAISAIAGYLARRARARFQAEIARAAAAPGEDAINLAEEALPFDNEGLELGERAGRESAAR